MCVTIIVYKQPNKSKSAQLSRALNGYKDYSNYGKYSYKRKGLLDKIAYKKLFRGVFLVKNKDADEFIQLLDKFDVAYYTGTIEKMSSPVDLSR